jgi:hypothetical protein
MQQFDVLATAGRVYGFLFREFGTILRLSWLPLLLVIVFEYFASRVLADPVPDPWGPRKAVTPPSDMLSVFADVFPSPGVMLTMFADMMGTVMVAVALHRVILFGKRRHGRLFYLSFGRMEWLFLAVWLVALVVGTALLAMVDSMELLWFPPPRWLFTLLYLFVFSAVMYLWIRFSLIFPVTVVKHRYDFAEVQAITRGHFWGLLGVWLIVFIGPVLLLSASLSLLFVSGVVSWDLLMSISVDPEMMARYAEDVPKLLRSSALQFVVMLVTGALGVAVLSYSYKALKGHDLDEFLKPQA